MSELEMKAPEKKKQGRPIGYSPKRETPAQPKPQVGMELTLDSDWITVRIPRKALTKKLLAELL